ncbi:transposable element Tcb1 transposase [Trichonephila clavipes]|nr:transposable element Tcb1 transposase [Trichonephila clavipes]
MAPRRHFSTRQCRPHRARLSQYCLRTFTTLPWPARSPDLSPIEHIWDHLGRRVGHPTSWNELEARLQQIWNEMSQEIQNLYASMPDRNASCIHTRGGSTSLNTPSPHPENGNVTEETVDLARQMNLEEDSDGAQELLDSHNREADS